MDEYYSLGNYVIHFLIPHSALGLSCLRRENHKGPYKDIWLRIWKRYEKQYNCLNCELRTLATVSFMENPFFRDVLSSLYNTNS